MRCVASCAIGPVFLLCLTLCSVRNATAQISIGEIPNRTYYIANGVYYDGDFASARKGYQEAYKSGISSTEGRWADSICFHTMLGESYYELGDVTQALDQYASALKLYIAQANWMVRIEFPPAIEPAAPTTVITWGNTSRNTRLGAFPGKYTLLRDTLTATAPNDKGGFFLVAGKEAIGIRAQEIARCIALAMKRRREIMGPTCMRDRLTDDVLTVASRRIGPPNNWCQCWLDIQLGMAYSAAGKDAQAISELTKGLQALGTFDHDLSSIGLLELGHLAMAQRKYDQAGTLFLEATYSAAMFGHYDDMEEGFRYAQNCWHLTGKAGPLPALAGALAWVEREKVRKLEVAIRMLSAEGFYLNGENAAAIAMLGTVQKAMFRKEMSATRIGARFQFEMARTAFAQGNLADGGAALAGALKFNQASSKRIFQIALADSMVTSGAVAERDADLLYTELLREPTADDWSLDPFDSLTVASTPYPGALEHWFEVALRRKEQEKAIEIADRIKRQHFFSTLPLGGRLLALRWILEAPIDMLPPPVQVQRRDLLQKYPRYSEVSLQATAAKRDVDALPLLPEDDDERKKLTDAYGKLAKLAALQEVMLRDLALRREPSDFVFPPALNMVELRKRIPERTLVLSQAFIAGKCYCFAISREKYMVASGETTKKIGTEIASLLKAWGHLEKNNAVDAKDLTSVAWRPIARRLLKSLTNNMKDENWNGYDELIVVPDGVTWYLPFESLPLSDEPDAPPLISKIRVRYVPTLGLAAPDQALRAESPRTAVVAGKLSPRDELAVSAAAFDELNEKTPGLTRLFSNLPAPSGLFTSSCDQLIVYHDLEEGNKGVYEWSPCPVDKGKAGSQLGDWIGLPWQGPKQLVLPGYHTAAEAGLKRAASGDELFLASCALLASGTKTALLSRWRTAGKTSYDLMREFVLESPHSSANAAWQRSVLLSHEGEFDPKAEPRVKYSPEVEDMKPTHPFFWSGYLLIDTGAETREESEKRRAAAAEAPAEKKP